MVQPESLLEGLPAFLDASPKNHHNTLSGKRKRGRSSSPPKIKDNESNEDNATVFPLSSRYPPLPEEPNKGDKNIMCRVGVRLPNGHHVQPNFLRTDSIQLLWSFCFAQLIGKDEMMKQFLLTLSIPGASNKELDYESNVNFRGVRTCKLYDIDDLGMIY